MKKFVVLLRGINVGGHHKIRMVDLRELCKKIGFPRVATYIQSGNIVLRSDSSSPKIAEKIKAAINKKFGFEPSVLVIEADQFVSIAEKYPFEVSNHKEAHIVFLDDKPTKDAIAELEKIETGPDKMKITPAAVHLHLPNGVSGATIHFKAIENTLGVPGTGRNRRTIEKLVKMINSPKI